MMAEKTIKEKIRRPEGFSEDPARNPEWVVLKLRKSNTLLYVVAIFIGIGLCIGTLSVLLS